MNAWFGLKIDPNDNDILVTSYAHLNSNLTRLISPQIDRLIPVSGPDEMNQFSEMFNRKAQRDLTDGHLWLSVLMRPPESRFTRSGRISVCLFLLFLTMLATCMFYKKPGGQKSAAAGGLVIGPFKITPDEVRRERMR